MPAGPGAGSAATRNQPATQAHMTTDHDSGLKLLSTVLADGTLQLTLGRVLTPAPGVDEVVLRMEATPINPSDMGTLLGAADPGTATLSGAGEHAVATLQIPEAARSAMLARAGKPMGIGFEGAGTVIAAGSSPKAQALMGRTVAVLGDALFAQFRCVPVDRCHLLPMGTRPSQGASFFINPLTALGMVGTMRLEGHRALVHTAAASNVGQMLNRLCQRDGIALINIVRRAEHVEYLRSQGARFVLDSESNSFSADLVAALSETGATIAFDAIGGGPLAGQILQSMETAIAAGADLGRYGSTVHKQIYLYGGLNPSATELRRNYGMAWGVDGWLVHAFLQRVGPDESEKMKARVLAELTTTFRTEFTREISLLGVLQPENIATYAKRATGEKFVVNPSLEA